MRLISTAAQCRALDDDTIRGLGVPGAALMELASKATADAVLEHHAEAASRGVLVLCGAGNNGGDGFGAARWLKRAGIDVACWPLAGASTGDAATMRAAAAAIGVPEVDEPRACGVVIDALFGTGLTRPLEGRAAAMLRAAAQLDAVVVAVDLPSGLHADTGARLGDVLPAARTVTFGRLKPAFFSEAASLCGAVHLVDIGVARVGHAVAALPSPTDLAPLWPRRAADAYKGSSGHVGVVAGSAAMAGAAVLACLGAIRGGAGLVTLFTPPEAVPRLVDLPASVMVRALPIPEALGQLDGFDAVAVGPGLGGGAPLSPQTQSGLVRLLAGDQRVVADADALFPATVGPSVVRTPHVGEAARLLGCSVAAIRADRFRAARALPGITILKGRHSLISDGGERVWVNEAGAPTLATAGSGDVLTGLVAALLARGVAPFEAAALGVHVHGRAGELLLRRREEGWNANDIAAALPDAIQELLDAAR